MDAVNWQDLVVPGTIPMSWLGYAIEKELSVDKLVDQAGLAAERATSFSAGVSLIKLLRLISVVHEHTGDDGVGFEVGWRMPPTIYGNLGHLLLASATLGDALQVLQRFWQLVARGFVLDVTLQDDQAMLSFFPQIPLAGALRRIVVESILVSMYRSITLFTSEAVTKVEIWFDYPEPDYGVCLRKRMPGVRFGMPLVQVRSPIELLESSSPMASAAIQLTAAQQCELEERTLNMKSKLTVRVQNELGFRETGYPSLVQIAGSLGITARTLRRKLDEEGTSYSILLDAARLRDATLLLENHSLEVTQVAEFLGYKDVANFARAFRKWTGKRPSQFRESMREGG